MTTPTTPCSVRIEYPGGEVYVYSIRSFRNAMEELDPFYPNYKIKLIWRLEQEGVLGSELQPVPDRKNDTAYWHWPVLQPDKLPEDLREDYAKYREVRW